MISVLTIIAPVFALIVIGYVCARSGYLSVATGRAVTDFSFKLAIPALLFRTVVVADFSGIAPVGILMSFFLSAAVVWMGATFANGVLLRRPAADAPALAMCCVFGNTIMLGLPIGVATLGPDALAPMSVILGVHAPIFLFAATLHQTAVETERETAVPQVILGILRTLSRQPLIVAIALGTLIRVLGIPMPALILQTADLMAKAGVPTALIALGISLSAFKIGGEVKTLSVMLVLKLVVMPLLAALLSAVVFNLPAISAEGVVLMAALPAGANAYIYSAKVGNVEESASGSVALGTALSAISLAGLITVFRALV